MPQDAPPITLEKPSQLPGAPMSALIGWDQACLICKYNLKHLALHESCPECGTPVNIAIRRSRMVYQPIVWIQRLLLGATVALVGAVMSIALVVYLGAISSFTMNWTWDYPFWFEFALPVIGSLGVGVLATGMLLISWGSPPGCKRRVVAEWITRCASALVLIAAITLAALTAFHWYQEQIGSGNQYGYSTVSAGYTYGVIGIAWVLCTIAFPFMFFAGIAQLRLLASLIPSSRSTRRIRWTFWLAIGGAGTLAVAFFVQIMLYMGAAQAQSNAYSANPNGPFPDDPWYIDLPTYFMALLAVGFVLQTCWMFFGLRRDLAKVVGEAAKR